MLHRPGLVVLTGPPGCGRTTLLRRLSAAVPGPVHEGGGLAMLQTVPALALSRAVRAKLPAYDVHLLAEAVRSRVRGGLLVIDDLHYTDPATLAALPLLAAHCRVLASVRTPHRLPPATETALRAAATAWIAVPPLTPHEATDLARRSAPHLEAAALTAVVDRAGGNPLAVTALARNAATGARPAAGGADIDQVAYAIATALADLPRPARTALAALGLLGRPAPAALLGAGAADLRAAGLVTADPDGALLPVSTYVAETAAGLLDAAARVDLHTRLAELTPPAEAARHLAAAGDLRGAHRRALTAADQSTGGDRAALLLFACELDVPVDLRVRLAAADALLAVGRPAAAARVLTTSAEPSRAGRPAGDAFSADFDFPHPPTAPSGTDLDFAARSGSDLNFAGPSAARSGTHSAFAAGSGTDLDFADPSAARTGRKVPGSPSQLSDGDFDFPRPSPGGAESPAQPAGGVNAPSSAAPARRRDAPDVLSGAARSHLDSDSLRSLELEADVLRGEALLQAGDPAAARAAVHTVPDAAAAPVVAGRDRVLLLAELDTDPAAARDLADKIAARHPRPPAGVAAALAAVRAHFRLPGWDTALAEAAMPGADPLITRWSAWLLVEQLAADGRLTESASVALRAARASAADLAYGWQTRFAAAADWALALHGSTIADPATGATSTSPGSAANPTGATPASVGGAANPTADTSPSATTANPTAAMSPSGRAANPAGTTSTSDGRAAGLTGTASALAAGAPGTTGARSDPAASPPGPGGARAATPGSGSGPAGPAQGLGHMRPGGIYGAATRSGEPLPIPGASTGAGGSAMPTPGVGGVHGPDTGQPGSASGTAPAVAADEVIAELWDGADGVLRRAGNLTDRALPDEARGYATAATALIEADTGLLAAARAHLDGGPAHPATSWVAQETAWLDGQPDRAVTPGGDDESGLLAGLHAITAQWAAHDLGTDTAPVVPGGLPAAARRTLTAWATGTGFTAAAEGWRPIALRERIRCLLAAGLTDTDQARAVEALLAAERLADAAGLTVLAGRARRGLRRHRVHRDTRSKRSGDQLTRRETDVLRLVAAGEPTRRIAGQLGISAETVDTHIRAGMRKLGARTRTEAAALAFASPARPDTSDKDGR
ncbi:LuxR C-terminal-related transcriptional regulator [Paractinoplanes atraurantiacus]